jgi:hypothetical protein
MLRWRLSFLLFPGPPPGVQLISAVSPWRLDLEGKFRVEDTGCCPSSYTSACRLDTASFESRGSVVVVGLGALLLQWCQTVHDTPDPRLLQKRC